MRKVVFYSWQSDLPSAINGSFIENALSRAIKDIKRDESSELSPVIDRDTASISGAPDISASIFSKIAMADLFVADVSITSGNATRSSPNPNVLVELGYAIAQLGWSKVILIMNSAFGGPEHLPFDLRGHRTIVYNVTEGSDRSQERGLLRGRLEFALRDELERDVKSALPSGRDAKLWWGKWEYKNGPGIVGYLFIREVGPSGFLFDIGTANGSHSGQLTAWARLITNDLAYCRVSNGEGAPDGELLLRRGIGERRWFIEVDEITSCSHHHGMRATFSGYFIREDEPLFESGILNEIELVRLYNLLGHHFEGFKSCIGDQLISQSLDADLHDVRVISGGLAGLYTIKEYVLMMGDSGSIWASYLNDDVVYYFTNVIEFRSRLPKTFSEWLGRFADREIIMCPPVSVMSQETH